MKTAIEVLASIDLTAAELTFKEAQKLWNILCALRGPDDGDLELKLRTTAIIRGAALPKLAARNNAYSNNIRESRPIYKCLPDPPPETHFGWHIEAAAKALNLMPK